MAALFLILSGCLNHVNRFQGQANALLASVNNLVASGHKTKDDFVREFGIPTACAPLKTGELCEWDTEIGAIGGGYTGVNQNSYTGQVYGALTVHTTANVSKQVRIEFDKEGNFLSGRTFVQRGARTFEGQSPKQASSLSQGSQQPMSKGDLVNFFWSLDRHANIILTYQSSGQPVSALYEFLSLDSDQSGVNVKEPGASAFDWHRVALDKIISAKLQQ